MSAQHADNTPRHIAIVMDGNGRWAKQRNLPRTAGHQAGVEAIRKTIFACRKSGVRYLTVFAFSSENWQRPTEEVNALMKLFVSALETETEGLIRNGVCLQFIGDRSAFEAALQERMAAAEHATVDCDALTLIIAANYGGQWDICQAAQALLQSPDAAELARHGVSQERFSEALSSSKTPYPDLFIRTGGERRISNFLLWQIAYAELYFTSVLWPDFDEQALFDAVTDFSNRQRRFGKTPEQAESQYG